MRNYVLIVYQKNFIIHLILLLFGFDVFICQQISWIRSRDHRIVAIGKIRYTQDKRFTPMNEDGNEVWVLKIQNARLSDSGNYECQISYHDDMENKLKMPVRLRVLGI